MKTSEAQTSRPIPPQPATRAFVMTVAMFLAIPLPGAAAVRTWSGASGGNWSTPGNWMGGVAPVSGDDLVFPAGAATLATTNNYADFRARSITFTGSGYTIRGSPLLVTNGISGQHASGNNAIEVPLSLGAAQTFECLTAGAGQSFSHITNHGFALTFSGNGNLTATGVISGSGDVTKNGTGTLTYTGVQNTYTGTTRVNRGTLALGCNGLDGAFRGPLVISDGTGPAEVRLLLADEMPDTTAVTIYVGGTLNLNNLNETIGSLTLQGGTASSGTGKLTLAGDVTVLASSTTATISGNLRFSGGLRTISVADGSVFYDLDLYANISDAGGGLLFTNATRVSNFVRLLGTNTFTGPLTVANIRLSAETPWALGATNSGTTVKSNATLWIYWTGITNEALTLEGDATWVGQYDCTWAGPVTFLNGNVLINNYDAGNRFDIIGPITGAGGCTKVGSGRVRFSGSVDNVYSGPTVVAVGTLELNKTGVAWAIGNGSLTIGDGSGGANADVVRYTGAGTDQLATIPIIINNSGLLDLNNHSDAVGTITMNGGAITTGTGLLAPGNITATAGGFGSPATIEGRLQLTATRTMEMLLGPYSPSLVIAAQISGIGGLTKTGPSALRLSASNTYSGLTVVSQGQLHLENAYALGDVGSGTVVSNGAGLILADAVNVGNEPLRLAGSGVDSQGALWSQNNGVASWAGPVTLEGDTAIGVVGPTGQLTLSGAISGTGDLTKLADGTLVLSGPGANTFIGTTRVNAGTLVLSKSVFDGAIPGDLVIGDGSGGANADVVRLTAINQITNSANVTLNRSGLLDLDGHLERFNALSGTGNLRFGAGGYAIVGHAGASSTFSGVASGDGFIWKVGAGTLTLTGTNTYTGQTRVQAGTLLVHGSQPQSPVWVESGATLGGNGTVGIIRGDGNVAPGASPGCLTSSNLTFAATGRLQVELNGQGYCTGHDQLVVRGTNNLANAKLQVTTAFPPGQPAIGDRFLILNNDGVEPITGTFDGLPNGALFKVGDIGFRIHYDGGNGNDVVLTVSDRPGASVTINATDRGWYDSTGFHSPANINYLVGDSDVDGRTIRNWFVFNVPTFTNPIVQAELLVDSFTNRSPYGLETYVLRHVATPIATLTNGGSGLTNIYADLGDGPVYGVRDVAVLESGERLIIPLNLTFIQNASAAQGGQIALGGEIATLDGTNHVQYLFGYSIGGAADAVQLRLTFGTTFITNALATGWYNNLGYHSASNPNYLAGEETWEPRIMRNFFVFGLPALPTLPVAAQLQVHSYTNRSPAGFLNYALRHVATPIGTLTNDAYTATNIYADLGDGILYGGRNVYVNESGTRSSIPLNGAFLQAAGAASGNLIALGGSVTLDPIPSNEFLFGYSLGSPGDARLWLGFAPTAAPAASFAPGSPTPLGGNRYQFVLQGTTGTTNEIQGSMDLVNWDVIATLYLSSPSLTFHHTNAVFPYRFFRTRILE